jgi:NADPH-dependent 7-cyano-7-deazaguanine reductase QueF
MAWAASAVPCWTLAVNILDDLVKALDPHYCQVVGAFGVRGGIAITVEATYERETGQGSGA